MGSYRNDNMMSKTIIADSRLEMVPEEISADLRVSETDGGAAPDHYMGINMNVMQSRSIINPN